jgi:early endosome antigen 1
VADEGEGFICPACMVSFPSPQDLETHYEREHNNDGNNGNGNNGNNGNMEHLKEEVHGLQTTLKEEQFYSGELKKEVERLSTAVHKSTEHNVNDQSEVTMYESQVKALSEAKELCKEQFRNI